MELRWWSIEVLDGPLDTARAWRESLGNALTEAAITNGAYGWEWHTHAWGVLFEIALRTDEAWESFRALPVVAAALDAVPDPARGLFVYQGRGGTGGRTRPRHPHPITGGGSAEAPIPDDRELITLGGFATPEPSATPGLGTRPGLITAGLLDPDRSPAPATWGCLVTAPRA